MNLKPWIISARPKTLPLAISSLLVGNCLAYFVHSFHYPILILTLITGCLLQILSNLANDYGDAVKGLDDDSRIGPLRAIQLGTISLPQLKTSLYVLIALCVISGLFLLSMSYDTFTEFLGFITLGLISIIAAITYTIGRHAYGYLGLGDLSVLIFFGFISIFGSFYLQTKSFHLFLIYPSISCGLLAVAVLNLNNLRDYHNDKQKNKITLIVMLGIKFGKIYHFMLIFIAFLNLLFFTLSYLKHGWIFIYLLTLPLLIIHVRQVKIAQSAVDFVPELERMVKLALFIQSLFMISLVFN